MKICSVEGCTHLIQCKGLCSGHYQRFHRYGVTGGILRSRENYGKIDSLLKEIVGEIKEKYCNIYNCNNVRHSAGLCKNHFDQWNIDNMR